ncbi:tRNA pseudouridine(38-40) synthase TruA [Xanthomarina sp. F2636L]|uniref:tRNA pseudouridine(38-40) synthase TruA n=1 Tax=Xanthomarina sp. F2636L TaxID=2996018 RepID=UPI00225DD254|nr:tRNA pseudouridine(38-40) synthase TruA [Xanthomarina sp. F2636L]MCX7551972.1 tRNA pseudouridine(38-40) synthase TruA [Xanthomarina sp. F2636L]
MRYFLELTYNGKDYHGWQNQPNAISVQEVVEKALSTLLNNATAIVGAGRTDAGVHAKQMFAHFDTDTVFVTEDLIYKLNSFLPNNIAILDVFKVKPEAHARFHALSRKYLYRISLTKDVFNSDGSYYLKQDLNMTKMKEATKLLLGYKDFQCFSKSQTDVNTYYCNIMHAKWHLVDNELQFTIKADRFLRNMVRAIVGTLINVGLGKLDVEDIHNILASKNRSEAGFSVPAHGLYLIEVAYPEAIKLSEQ